MIFENCDHKSEEHFIISYYYLNICLLYLYTYFLYDMNPRYRLLSPSYGGAPIGKAAQ